MMNSTETTETEMIVFLSFKVHGLVREEHNTSRTETVNNWTCVLQREGQVIVQGRSGCD